MDGVLKVISEVTDGIFWLVFAIVLVGYTAVSTFVQFKFYRASNAKETVEDWKLQSNKLPSDSDVWWLPAACKRRVPKHPRNSLYCSINLVVQALAISFAFSLSRYGFVSAKGGSFFAWRNGKASVFNHLEMLIWPQLYQIVAEYVWHRIMHLPFFYRHFHKIHHDNTAPTPFDDLLIHPLEGMGYAFLAFFAPVLLFDMHLVHFFLYLIILGITGIMDHAGVVFKVSIPFLGSLYSAKDHDMHHKLFNCNYGFPIPLMDILFGTFVGEWMGIKSSSLKERGRKSK